MMVKRIKLVIFGIGAVVFPLSGCAIQQDMALLQERVIVVERQQQELQRRHNALEKQVQEELANLGRYSENAEKNLRSQYAGVNVTLDTVQQEQRLLTGRIEEIEYLLNRKLADSETQGKKSEERLDEIAAAMAKVRERLAVLERYLNMGGQAAGVAPNVPTVAPAPAKKDLYALGKQAFDQGDWEKSRQLFNQLLKEQPQSENADNAQFWIGETYYNEPWYEKAILEYQNVIERYPKGNKVPAAMLKQGLAFFKLGDQSSAREVLKRLVEKYPKSNEAAIAKKQLNDI